jgi:hypothetical protein
MISRQIFEKKNLEMVLKNGFISRIFGYLLISFQYDSYAYHLYKIQTNFWFQRPITFLIVHEKLLM